MLKRLHEVFPFKHFKKEEGDFLGRFLRQDEDFSIRVSQKDYPEGLEHVRISRGSRGSIRLVLRTW